MGIFDRFREKKPDIIVTPELSTGKSVPEKVFSPPVDGIYLPQGCNREADMIVVDREYFQQWLQQYPDAISASSKMIAHLKKNYPSITRFRIKK